MARLLRTLFGLISAILSLLFLKGCKPAPLPPAVAGVSIELRYPVLLIGQKTFDKRDSAEDLVKVFGYTSLNLIERVILDSDGRLFEVVSSRAEEGSEPIFLSMGTKPTRHEVVLRELKKPSIEKIQKLLLAEVNAPYSFWANEPGFVEKAEEKIRSLQSVEEVIASCGEHWSWTR